MKITGRQLRRLIREELGRTLFEADQVGEVPYSKEALRSAPVGAKIVAMLQSGPFEFTEKKSADLFQTSSPITTNQVIKSLTDTAKLKYTPDFLNSQESEFTIRFSEQNPQQQRYSTGDIILYPDGGGQFTMIDAVAGPSAYDKIDRVLNNFASDTGARIVIRNP